MMHNITADNSTRTTHISHSVTPPKASLSPPFPTSTLWSGPVPSTIPKQNDKFASSDLQHYVNEILDLRKQVSELLRYREQCSNLRAQVALVEEREKLREAEANSKTNELVERVRSLEEVESKLRGQNIRLEEEKSEVTRKYTQQVSNLHAQLAALSADAERRETNIHRLEYELALAKSTVSQQQQFQERDRTHQVLARQLKDQVTQLLSEKLALEGQISSSETKLQYTFSDLKDAQLALEKEQSKRVMVEKERDALRGDIAALGGEINSWRQSSTTIAALQQEIQSLSSFKEEVMYVKSALAVAEEDKRRLSDTIRHLEQQLNQHAQQNAEMIDFRSQFQEFKTKTELLNHDLERTHILSDKLRDQLAKAQQKVDSCSVELHRVLLAARGAVGTNGIKRYNDSGADMLDIMWMELHDLMETLSSENTNLKNKCTSTKSDIDSLLQNRNSAIMNANLRVNELEERSRSQVTTIESLQRSCADLNSQISQLKAEQSVYLKYAQKLYADLDNMDTSTPQSRKSSYLTKTDVLNADMSTIQSQLVEKLAKLLSTNSALQGAVAELLQQLDEKSYLLVEAHRKASEYAEKSLSVQEEQRQVMEARHKAALEAMQRTFETRCTILEERYREAAEVYQAAEHNQTNLDARYKEVLVRLARQTDEIEILFYAIGLLVRVLHPLRTKMAELISQKEFLQYTGKDTHQLKDGVLLLAHALTGHFDDSAAPLATPKKHASFRVAGIAVVAYNKWRKIWRSRSKFEFIHVGHEKLVIAPKTLILHAKDIPVLAVGDDSTSLHQLLTHFDKLESKNTRHAPSFLDNLRTIARMHLGRNTSALAIVRKTTLDIMRRLKEKEQDNEALSQAIAKLQASYFNIEHSLAHSQDMCAMLENRVHQLQEEGTEAWNTQLLDLRTSLQEQMQKVAELQLANTHLQTNLQTKEETIATLNLVVQQKSDEKSAAKDAQAHIDTLSSQLAMINRRIVEKDEALKELESVAHKKERDIRGAHELVTALTEAHQKATEKNNVLIHQLEQSRLHIQNLKRELQQTLERGVEEENSHTNIKWARVTELGADTHFSRTGYP